MLDRGALKELLQFFLNRKDRRFLGKVLWWSIRMELLKKGTMDEIDALFKEWEHQRINNS